MKSNKIWNCKENDDIRIHYMKSIFSQQNNCCKKLISRCKMIIPTITLFVGRLSQMQSCQIFITSKVFFFLLQNIISSHEKNTFLRWYFTQRSTLCPLQIQGLLLKRLVLVAVTYYLHPAFRCNWKFISLAKTSLVTNGWTFSTKYIIVANTFLLSKLFYC